MTRPVLAASPFRNITRELLEPLWMASSYRVGDIAAKLGVSASGLHYHATEVLGLPHRGPRLRKLGSDAEFARLWSAGVSSRQIADHFGYSYPRNVRARARKLGLAPRGEERGTHTLTVAQYREQAYADAMSGARP